MSILYKNVRFVLFRKNSIVSVRSVITTKLNTFKIKLFMSFISMWDTCDPPPYRPTFFHFHNFLGGNWLNNRHTSDFGVGLSSYHINFGFTTGTSEGTDLVHMGKGTGCPSARYVGDLPRPLPPPPPPSQLSKISKFGMISNGTRGRDV